MSLVARSTPAGTSAGQADSTLASRRSALRSKPKLRSDSATSANTLTVSERRSSFKVYDPDNDLSEAFANRLAIEGQEQEISSSKHTSRHPRIVEGMKSTANRMQSTAHTAKSSVARVRSRIRSATQTKTSSSRSEQRMELRGQLGLLSSRLFTKALPVTLLHTIAGHHHPTNRQRKLWTRDLTALSLR